MTRTATRSYNTGRCRQRRNELSLFLFLALLFNNLHAASAVRKDGRRGPGAPTTRTSERFGRKLADENGETVTDPGVDCTEALSCEDCSEMALVLINKNVTAVTCSWSGEQCEEMAPSADLSAEIETMCDMAVPDSEVEGGEQPELSDSEGLDPQVQALEPESTKNETVLDNAPGDELASESDETDADGSDGDAVDGVDEGGDGADEATPEDEADDKDAPEDDAEALDAEDEAATPETSESETLTNQSAIQDVSPPPQTLFSVITEIPESESEGESQIIETQPSDISAESASGALAEPPTLHPTSVAGDATDGPDEADGVEDDMGGEGDDFGPDEADGPEQDLGDGGDEFDWGDDDAEFDDDQAEADAIDKEDGPDISDFTDDEQTDDMMVKPNDDQAPTEEDDDVAEGGNDDDVAPTDDASASTQDAADGFDKVGNDDLAEGAPAEPKEDKEPTEPVEAYDREDQTGRSTTKLAVIALLVGGLVALWVRRRMSGSGLSAESSQYQEVFTKESDDEEWGWDNDPITPPSSALEMSRMKPKAANNGIIGGSSARAAKPSSLPPKKGTPAGNGGAFRMKPQSKPVAPAAPSQQLKPLPKPKPPTDDIFAEMGLSAKPTFKKGGTANRSTNSSAAASGSRWSSAVTSGSSQVGASPADSWGDDDLDDLLNS